MSERLPPGLPPLPAGSIPPRIAVLGCGAIAEQYYLPALARFPEVVPGLVLVDPDETRARYLADKTGVQKTSGDYRQVLTEVDAAILAVPTHLHHPIALDLMAHGIHVYSEKPLAETAARAREMVEAADRAGVVLAGNYQRRLFPPLVKVKEILAEGSLGAPRSFRYLVGELFDWQAVTGFRFAAGTSAGGVLRDRGAHVMYVLTWWLGARPTVLASYNDSFGGPEAVAYLRLAHDGCEGEVLLSWLSKFTPRFVIQCERGTIEGGIYDTDSILLTAGNGGQKRLKLQAWPRTYHEIAAGMVGNFLRAIAGLEAPLVSGRDALPSLELIDDCYQAAVPFDMPWYRVLGVEVNHGR